jgi:hypothetical protein
MSEFAGGGVPKKHESTTNKTNLGEKKHEWMKQKTGSVNYPTNVGVLKTQLGFFNPVPFVFSPCPCIYHRVRGFL